ncbi:MAG: nucleotidyltransferase domain-containing protein [Nanoarchaeota archaeon]
MNTKLKIIMELEKKPGGIHLRELSRLVNTGLPNIKRIVDILEKEKVIKKQKEANLLKIYLKESPKTIAYLKQFHTDKFLTLPFTIKNAVQDFISELEIKPLIVLIFGSYAKGTYTKNSDIDILLVFQNVEDAEKIENTARRISMRTNTNISPVYINYEHFAKNFLDKGHDFSREIRKEVLLLSGIELYYNLLWRFLS